MNIIQRTDGRYEVGDRIFQTEVEAKAFVDGAATVAAKPEVEEAPKESGPKLWLWIPLGLVAAFLLFGAIKSNTPEGRAKADARQAIELCWQQQGRKSHDGGTARFIAGACEGMESDFVRKYGVKP